MTYKFVGDPKRYNLKVKLRKGRKYKADTVLLDKGITLEKLIAASRKDVEENHKVFAEESREFLNDWE